MRSAVSGVGSPLAATSHERSAQAPTLHCRAWISWQRRRRVELGDADRQLRGDLGEVVFQDLAVLHEQLAADVNLLEVQYVAGEDQRGVGVEDRRPVEGLRVDHEDVAKLALLERTDLVGDVEHLRAAERMELEDVERLQ